MKMHYLLDTNILSEPVKPDPSPMVMEKLKRNRDQSVTAAPVWFELVHGVEQLPPSHRRDRLARYLQELAASDLQVLGYDQSAAHWHALEHTRLRANGQTRPFIDGQIAAVAAVHGLVLVSRNLIDFQIFSGLIVENWFA
ncbi:MAG: type II toxin-antitoxin system VapC family toxin [Candidatus Competibacteraceae bacterium]|nr:type II toxin-antitoxin system VapC family toxin [Candidatus Competibacteraceae bacterium]